VDLLCSYSAFIELLWSLCLYAGLTTSASVPYFTEEPLSSVVRRGDSVTLHCTASSTSPSLPDAESNHGIQIIDVKINVTEKWKKNVRKR